MLPYRARRAAAIRVSWARIPSSAAGTTPVSLPASPLAAEGPATASKTGAAPPRPPAISGRGEAAGRAPGPPLPKCQRRPIASAAAAPKARQTIGRPKRTPPRPEQKSARPAPSPAATPVTAPADRRCRPKNRHNPPPHGDTGQFYVHQRQQRMEPARNSRLSGSGRSPCPCSRG